MTKKLEEAIKRIYIMKNYICVDSDEDEENQEGIRDIEAIETILNYIENSIPKQVIEEKQTKLQKEYKEALDENSTKAFILKCQIEVLKELLEEK